MSTIVRFFAAPDDKSASRVLRTGPRRVFESLPFGNFDPEEAVLEWESLLTDVSFEELIAAGEPHLIAGKDDDGPVVFAFSPLLCTALAEAGRSELKDAAAAWFLRQEGSRRVFNTELADLILSDVAALVRKARDQGRSVYCWVG
ncbi:hypothetical protein SRB5_46350 [Streptomyces sp. RB5]|uniref:DUF1877 family protein n=1 Tax=Streptomyces smaragdinus TaxID=2585196 RepID=A0A7K0CLV1_9ACTN|nr:hypothetical protein [Streptomyces smaragdinus]MQY14468.1 hypothetical protein [Streptomyces smaragdinus]